MLRILAADIGGTHSRFGFFAIDGAAGPALRRLGGVVRLNTKDFPGFADLLDGLFAAPRPFAARECDFAALAAPGPLIEGVCRPPNIAWSIDSADLPRAGLARGELLNDFAAQAYACLSPAIAATEVVQPGRRDFAAGGAVAVIGAGTGLGCCALTPDGRGGLVAAASEAGHMAFPFLGAAECAYGERLRSALDLPYCECETVVSGPGLARLHEHLTGRRLDPVAVSARLSEFPKTAEWFARFYGRAARDYALAVLAAGGVCVSGGVAGNTPLLVRHPAFLAEFRSAVAPAHREFLAGVPVRLNRDDDFGVFGAARFAALRCAAL